MAKSGISLAIDTNIQESLLSLDATAFREFKAIKAGLEACIATLESYGISPERLYSATMRVAVVVEYDENHERYVLTSVIQLDPPPNGDGVPATPTRPRPPSDIGDSRAIIYRPGRRGRTSEIFMLGKPKTGKTYFRHAWRKPRQHRREIDIEAGLYARVMSVKARSRIGVDDAHVRARTLLDIFGVSVHALSAYKRTGEQRPSLRAAAVNLFENAMRARLSDPLSRSAEATLGLLFAQGAHPPSRGCQWMSELHPGVLARSFALPTPPGPEHT